jgi:hypothetical protein
MQHSRLVLAGIVIAASLVVLTPLADAQKPIAYPAKGQAQDQQTKDDGECYSWAKQNTGIDPASPPTAAPVQSSSSFGGGQRLRGAARGAAGGAIIGAIADDHAGEGAGIGAVAGVMAGGRQARREQAAKQQQAQAQQTQVMDTYYRAWGACMEGRGYTIK